MRRIRPLVRLHVMGILPITPGPLPELSGRPADGFLEATGERMALFGVLDHLELWMWPVQVAREIALEIRRAGEREPLELERRLHVTPAGFRVEHRAADFTLVMEAFASRTSRALVILLGMQGAARLEVALRFVPTLRAMWPAAIGGRIGAVDEESGALILTEELGRFAVLIGSPEAEHLRAGLDHGLAEEELRLVLRPEVMGARTDPLPILVAGAERGLEPLPPEARVGGAGAAHGFARARPVLDEARERWRALQIVWPDERNEHARHWREFSGRTSALAGGEPDFERAFLWAKLAIERAWVRLDALIGLDGAPARGLVAGIGPSRGTERPGYAWLFNGDALSSARALTAVGDFGGAGEVLRLAARTQRADGKLSHELTLALRLCDWIEDYPYAYYKASQTPGFVNVAWHVVRAAGDADLARELAPAVGAALAWCRTTLDEKRRMLVPVAGLAAVEAGPLAGQIASEVFLQGIWCDALRSGAALADFAGLEGAQLPAHEWLGLAREAGGIASFWRPELGRHGFAELRGGGRCDDRSGYLGLALARGLDTPERCLASAMELNHPLLMSDWGVRMFGEDAEVYDSEHYNTGSVFPYLTGFVVLALYRHGLPMHALQVLASQVALDGFDGPGVVPEYLTGERASTTRRGVPHQIFSSAAIVQGIVYGLFGVEQHADRLVLAPSLAPDWKHARLEHLRAGKSRVEVDFTRSRDVEGSTLEIALAPSAGPSLMLTVEPRFGWGSLAGEVTLDGEPQPVEWIVEPGGMLRACVQPFALDRPRVLRLRLREGPLLRLPAGPSGRGAASEHPRLVRVEHEDERARWELWGLAESRARLPLWSDRSLRLGGACLERGDAEGASTLAVEFPPSRAGERFTRADVTLALDTGPAAR